ncbi:MAG: ABC-2 transporter permease [Lachnospiraceae bacterium]|nr:ABC-2 transporter permease [Lachnospiraceae bacterium]
MKGLLIKDFKLMKGQKNFFFLVVLVSIGMPAFSGDATFMLGFLPFVLSMFTLSTISYDEFDNGNAFLFTLPVSRTGYAVEKYILALLLGGGAWVFATLLAVAFAVIKGTANISEILMAAVLILPVLIVIQALMIPFQLKFGSEKGRLALIGAFGLLAVIGVVAVKAAEMLGIDLWELIGNLPAMGMGVMITLLLLAAILVLLTSMKISCSIMKGKEF